MAMDENSRKQAAASLLEEMTVIAHRMRELIIAMPPHDLLGYIFASDFHQHHVARLTLNQCRNLVVEAAYDRIGHPPSN